MITHIVDVNGNSIPIEEFLKNNPELIKRDDGIFLNRFKNLFERKPNSDYSDVEKELLKHNVDLFYNEELKRIQSKEFDFKIMLDLYKLLLNALKTYKSDSLIDKIQYKYFKSRINELIGVVQIQSSYPTDKSEELKYNLTGRLWFKAGIHIANGDLYRMRERLPNGKVKSFLNIAKELGNASFQAYFSTSFNDTVKDLNKNIYCNLEHLIEIRDYCINNKISLCQEFIDKYNKIQP